MLIRERSISWHVRAIVLGAVIPLGIIGAWLTRSAMRSGEILLGEQLDSSRASVARSTAERWERRRGLLLLVPNSSPGRKLLSKVSLSRSESSFVAELSDSVRLIAASLVLRDISGSEVFALKREHDSTRSFAGVQSLSVPPTIAITLPVVHDSEEFGSIEADVYLDALIPDSTRVLLPGATFAVRGRNDSVTIRGITRDYGFPEKNRFSVGEVSWMARVDSVHDSPIDIAVAAPVGPFVDPFVRAGETGLIALAVVLSVTLLLAGLVSGRLATSFRQLAEAAGFVARGDLTRRVESEGPEELQQLSSAFNTMTDSLRRNVAELTERRSLAAVGEFATQQSHEVRNALTSVQLYLEKVDERSEDPRNRELLSKTLAQVRKLDAAVTGSLRIARSGKVAAMDIDLRDVVREAARRAAPNFASMRASLTQVMPDAPVHVRGDPEALQQLLLNLLLNAQQVIREGGTTFISLGIVHHRAVVSITDDGRGMNEEEKARVFEPFYTTRPNGTGLGLSISRQIASAHGGALEIESSWGVGTTVRLVLPVANGTPENAKAMDTPNGGTISSAFR